MQWKKLFLFGLILQTDALMSDMLRPKIVRVQKFQGTCAGHEDAPLILKNIHLGYSNKIHIVSVQTVARENITEPLKMRLSLKRCQSREVLDTCEKYQTIVIPRFCSLINAENQPWSPLTKLSQPPIRCPILKGSYYIRNGTFDASAFTRLPISGWYWIAKVHLVGEKSNRIIMCVDFEGQLISS